MNVPSYGALKTKISCLNKVVKNEKLRNEWLLKENNIQARIISQLKSFLSLNQTKSVCMLGHKWCRIDHTKYNLIKQVVKVPHKQERCLNKKLSQNSSLRPQKECSWIKICAELQVNCSSGMVYPLQLKEIWIKIMSFLS